MQPGASSAFVVRGGTCVLPSGRHDVDLVIDHGRIEQLLSPGGASDGLPVLDATGLLVLPGLVDAHVHLRDPGPTYKETVASASAAAALGGVTTMMVMPYDDPLTLTRAAAEDRGAYLEGRSSVDFALQAAADPASPHTIADTAAAGVVSFELQLADWPGRLGLEDPAQLLALLRACAVSRRVLGVYCDEPSLIGPAHPGVATTRDPLGEELAVGLVCAAAVATGAPVHIRQASTARTVSQLMGAQARGADLTGEVTPHHLLLAAADVTDLGGLAAVLPPLRAHDDTDALVHAVRSATVSIVASDHAPHALAEKQGREHPPLPGLPGLETLAAAVLEAFGDHGPEVLASACAQAPAARFGLADRKGSLLPGMDADLLLLDPGADVVVEPDRFATRAHYSPFVGRTFPGKVVHVVLRGRQLVRDGVLLDHSPSGVWQRHREGPR